MVSRRGLWDCALGAARVALVASAAVVAVVWGFGLGPREFFDDANWRPFPGARCDDRRLLDSCTISLLSWLLAIEKRFLALPPFLYDPPSWAPALEATASALGSLLFPNLAVLFYPVSRGSALLQAAGVPYAAAIRHHRFLGHWVMILSTSHGFLYWAAWIVQGAWVKEALEWSAPRVSNAAGGVALLGGLVLWATSVEVVRRKCYSLFYAVHRIGFVVFFVGGLMHYQTLVWCVGRATPPRAHGDCERVRVQPRPTLQGGLPRSLALSAAPPAPARPHKRCTLKVLPAGPRAVRRGLGLPPRPALGRPRRRP